MVYSQKNQSLNSHGAAWQAVRRAGVTGHGERELDTPSPFAQFQTGLTLRFERSICDGA